MSISGYGLIYTHEFTNTNGIQEQFLIYQKDVSDNNTDIDAGESPITTSRGGNGDSSNHYDITIAYEQVTFTTLATSSLFQYATFADANEEKYLGVRKVWNGASFEEKFRGFQSPEFYFQDLYSTPVNVSLGFTDRLGDLQNYEFANDNIFDTSVHETFQTQLDVIAYALNRLNLEMDGIRVTHRIMENSINSAATDTALAQIYVDPYSYYELDEDLKVTSTFSLAQVIDSILKPYSATLYAYGGYYWIIEQQELQSASFDYVEYDMDGAYVTNATQSDHSITFKAASGSSDYWRWAGRQSLTFTPVYKYINLTLQGKLIEGGLTLPFIGKNAFTTGILGMTAFGNLIDGFVTKTVGNSLDSLFHGGNPYITDDDRQVVYYEAGAVSDQIVPDDDLPLRWTFSFRDDDNTATYVSNGKEISYTTGDRFKFSVKLQVRPTYSQGYTEPLREWPYYIMPWRLKVGTYYYDFIAATWTTTNTINQHFITEAAKDLTIDFEFPLRETTETADYDLDVYMPKRDEYDITDSTSESSMLSTLKAVTTTSLSDGHRTIARYDKNAGGGSFPVWNYYFYELLEGLDSGTEPDVVTPTDYNSVTNDKRYQLVANHTIVQFSGSVVELKGLDVFFLPQGKEPPSSIITKTAATENSVILESSLYHFDAPTQVSSSDLLYYNVLRHLDVVFTYTNLWSDGTNTIPIQNHRLNWLVANANTPRHRIQGGTIYRDVEVPPFASLLDTDNDNRRYRITSATIKHKSPLLSGGFVEISSDEVVTTNAFSTGFSKGFA